MQNNQRKVDLEEGEERGRKRERRGEMREKRERGEEGRKKSLEAARGGG